MSESGFSDRRASARLDMEKQVVYIRWKDESSTLQSRQATCLDVSRGGFKLELELSIPVNTFVEIQFTPESVSERQFKAKVIRCTQLKHGWYNIGLQF